MSAEKSNWRQELKDKPAVVVVGLVVFVLAMGRLGSGLQAYDVPLWVNACFVVFLLAVITTVLVCAWIAWSEKDREAAQDE